MDCSYLPKLFVGVLSMVLGVCIVLTIVSIGTVLTVVVLVK